MSRPGRDAFRSNRTFISRAAAVTAVGAEEATVDGPPRRRDSWSLKTLVEEVTGRPIDELQEPGRPVHPYLAIKRAAAPPPSPRATSASDELHPDPVTRVYPPLTGATARALHGPEFGHHAETLARHPPGRGGASAPSRLPERIYLHYLLLYLDHLSEPALRYLRQAVDEELGHRASSASEPAARTPSPPAPESVPAPEEPAEGRPALPAT